MGNRLPPPVTAWPLPDSNSLSVVDTTTVTGSPLWLPNCQRIDDEQLAIISKGLRDRHNEITAILTAANLRSPLDVLLGAESVEQMWDEVLTLGQKRAILAEVLAVTVLPTTSGGRAPDGSYFNRDAVRVELTERARCKLS